MSAAADFFLSLYEVIATLTREVGLKEVKSQNTEAATKLVLLLCHCYLT